MPCLDGADVRIVTLPNGVYKGTVNSDGQMHGKGVFTFSDGDTYDGGGRSSTNINKRIYL